MPTHLIEINLSGGDPPQEEEKLYKLVESFVNASRDTDSESVSAAGETDSVGVNVNVNGMGEEELRGIIVVRTQPLPRILQILSPHLPHFHSTPKISQTTERGIYDACGYSVQQLLIYLPLHPLHSLHSSNQFHSSHDSDHLTKTDEEKDRDEDEEKEEDSKENTKIQKLQTLFNVISMRLSSEGKVSGMRQGEIEGISSSSTFSSSDLSSVETETSSPEKEMKMETKIEKVMRFKGQDCRVWSVWTAWVAAGEKYDGCGKDGERGVRGDGDGEGEEGKEGESLAKRIDWGKMEVLGWEERTWVFMSFGEFLERGKEKRRCVVM
ncbi:5ab11d1f-2f40-4c6a-ab2e-9a9b2fa35bc0-CDS [Sclerotinia trifoliorum]|uniref:5ab11d1f-2f40-4c6a-ab2e-9a9b2fa35bc0-CDS n=1 Tax=Sclerotinia trifoliorum TaxID=28548 RepID=A0A8H2VYN6_9HELO|nr:5ab11d1f-2f40-4c6a-ab2e-9a9b2fa35bc0-CDS [Sclerotinia trifoliorum]